MNISNFSRLSYAGLRASAIRNTYSGSGTIRRSGTSRISGNNYNQTSVRSNVGTAGRSSFQRRLNQLYDISSDADSLKKSAHKLTDTRNNHLFTQKVATNSSGAAHTDNNNEYDKDAIYQAVDNFINDYNNSLASSKNSNNRAVLNAARSMQSSTAMMKRKLSEVGISVDKTGNLSVDKDVFQNADSKKVKNLFNGSSSYAGMVEAAALRAYNASSSQLGNPYTYGSSLYENSLYGSALSGNSLYGNSLNNALYGNGLYSGLGSYANAYAYLNSSFNGYF